MQIPGEVGIKEAGEMRKYEKAGANYDPWDEGTIGHVIQINDYVGVRRPWRDDLTQIC